MPDPQSPRTHRASARSIVSARHLREATRQLLLAHGALDDARRPCGAALSVPHAYALIELLGAEPMTVSALSARLSIDRTNVSRLCARMEARGELERSTHPTDKRAWLVRLTEHGLHVARAVDTSSAAHFERVLARLAPEAATIVDALRILTDAIRATPSLSPPENPT